MSFAARVLPLLLAFLFNGSVQAAGEPSYPAKPVRLVVPFAAGGLNDTLARVFGQALGDSLGVQTIIDNRPGASGMLGMNIGAKANPDGYTLVFSSSSAVAVSPNLYKLPYDPVKDFSPISPVSSVGSVLLVHLQLPVTSVAELITYAKTNPGRLKFGTVGPGTSQHLAGELFKMIAGVDLLHVPYKGGGQVLSDMMGRQIDIDFEPMPTALPYIKSGRLRPLALTSASRSQLLPDVPTLAEAGVRGYDASLWIGVLAAAGTPPAIVAKLNATLVKIVRSPEMTARLSSLGAEPMSQTPAEFRRFIENEIARWGKVVKALNIKVE